MLYYSSSRSSIRTIENIFINTTNEDRSKPVNKDNDGVTTNISRGSEQSFSVFCTR